MAHSSGFSLRENADELLTLFTFPKAQWKTLRTTNTIRHRRISPHHPLGRPAAQAMTMGAVKPLFNAMVAPWCRR